MSRSVIDVCVFIVCVHAQVCTCACVCVYVPLPPPLQLVLSQMRAVCCLPSAGPLASLSPPADSVVVLEESARGRGVVESPSESPESEDFEAMPSEPIFISSEPVSKTPHTPYSRVSPGGTQATAAKSTLTSGH